jgi:hypothetical protein
VTVILDDLVKVRVSNGTVVRQEFVERHVIEIIVIVVEQLSF